MEESRLATAAPEQTAAQEEKPPRRHRRVHVPTSVLVTLLVAALSVWVAPAFTRQWEDRKQARQLQAQIAEQIALATANLAERIDSTVIASGLKNDHPDDNRILLDDQAIKDYWRIRQTRIDAKLRAYYSPAVRSLWLEFNDVIAYEIAVVREARLAEVVFGQARWRPYIVRNLEAITLLSHKFGVAETLNIKTTADDLLGRELLRRHAIERLIAWVGDIEDKVIDRVMTEDPEAFSTTRRDLLRDLLP